MEENSMEPIYDGAPHNERHLFSLQMIWHRQHDLQTTSFGVDPRQLEGEALMEYIRGMVLALEDELHEALAETGWKPWADTTHLHADRFAGELVDALHFLVNLALVTGWTPEQFIDAYWAKAEVNARRQLAGYNGVDGKCPVCGRALDDPAVTCTAYECTDPQQPIFNDRATD